MIKDINLDIYLAQPNKYKELEIYGNIKLLLSDVEGFKNIKTYAFVDLDNLVSSIFELQTLHDLIIDTYGYAVKYTMSANKLMDLCKGNDFHDLYKKTVGKLESSQEYTLTHLNNFLDSRAIFIEVKEFLLTNKLKAIC